MKCPHCEVPLMMAERKGIEIDFCPQCRGVWLDKGELDKIIELSVGERAGARGGGAGYAQAQAYAQTQRQAPPQSQPQHQPQSQPQHRQGHSHPSGSYGGYGHGYGHKQRKYKKPKSLLSEVFDIFD